MRLPRRRRDYAVTTALAAARVPARAGGNAIEFALSLPVFLLLVVAVMDYGWYFFHASIADMAVSRGCREAAQLDPALADADTTAMYEMGEWLQVVGMSCETASCDVDQAGAFPRLRLVCGVEYDFDPLLGFAPTPAVVGRAAAVRQELQRAP